MTRAALVLAALALGACTRGPGPSGADLPELPARALAPCADPLDFIGPRLNRAEFEIAAGRMGDALIACGAEKQALGAYTVGLRADLAAAPKKEK